MPKLHFVIIKPPVELPTATVFSQVKKISPSTDKLECLTSSLQSGGLAQASEWMLNSLEKPASELSPWIRRLSGVFKRAGTWAQLMTGSGSAYFGIMRSARHARRTAKIFATQNLGTVLATSSC